MLVFVVQIISYKQGLVPGTQKNINAQRMCRIQQLLHTVILDWYTADDSSVS